MPLASLIYVNASSITRMLRKYCSITFTFSLLLAMIRFNRTFNRVAVSMFSFFSLRATSLFTSRYLFSSFTSFCRRSNWDTYTSFSLSFFFFSYAIWFLECYIRFSAESRVSSISLYSRFFLLSCSSSCLRMCRNCYLSFLYESICLCN